MALGSAETVGRESELERLDDALAALGEGGAACLSVEGEPGIGKTRLLAELQAKADEHGHLALRGTAAEFEQDVPFGVWVNALDAHVAELEDWDPELLEELGGIFPSLRPASGENDSAVADERYRAHRAVRALLELLAEEKPLVLVLDDLHWGDRASIELIAALMRRGPDAPVLLAFAFRPGQAPERLSAALAAPTVTRVELAQLSESQAGEMLTELDASALAEIYSHSGGNPFYLEQLARASSAGRLSGALRHAGNGAGELAGGVPGAVAAALAEELESLSLSARGLLNGAAVAGEPFEPDLAAAVAELSQPEGLAALDDLIDRDLVRPTEVPREFIFRHPLVRRAVYESTRGGWRLAAHARAAEALGARGAAATERAHHVEQSASQGDEAAIAVLLEAGDASASRAPGAAARWFEAALRLLPAADRERQAELRVALASALRSVGELERCRSILLEAIDLLPAESAERRLELVALCAAVEHWMGRHDEAHARLTRAWDDLPPGATPEAAALQIELAVDGLYEMDFEQALEMGRLALNAAVELDDGALIASAASALALGEAASGAIEAAREHLSTALEQVDRLTDQELAPRLEALYYLGWAENYLERYDDAVAHADRGLAIARATGEGRLLVPMMLVKGYPFEMQGRLTEAKEICEAAVESTRLSGNPHYLFWALFELGYAHYHLGDLDAVIEACEESARIGGRMVGGTMPAGGGGPAWVLASTQFELGELDRGFEHLPALGGEEFTKVIPVERCHSFESLALAELARDRPEAAEAYVRRAEELSASLDLHLPKALAHRARAAFMLHAGDAAGAAAEAKAAADGCTAAGAHLQTAFSNGLRGQALAAAGEKKEAVTVLREAEGELDECGSHRVRDEMRRELRKLGARAETRGRATAEESGIEALTKRELEIGALITDRMTNKQIASELFLSEKTIESHIRNIFIKLGASSRVEVARAIERDRREREEAS